MANVLAMPAGELRYPVALFVLVVAANRSLHEFSVPRRFDRVSGGACRQEPEVWQPHRAGTHIRQGCTRSRGLLVRRTLEPLRYDRSRIRFGTT